MVTVGGRAEDHGHRDGDGHRARFDEPLAVAVGPRGASGQVRSHHTAPLFCSATIHSTHSPPRWDILWGPHRSRWRSGQRTVFIAEGGGRVRWLRRVQV